MASDVKAISGKVWKWLFAIGLPLLILAIPVNEAFTIQAKLFLVFSIMAILIIALDLMNMVVPAILLPTCYTVFNVVEVGTAFKGFSTPTLWVILGAYALTVVLDECGILRRIALVVVKKLGGTYNATLYAIYVVGIILGQLTFCGHYFLLIGFVYGICKAMDLKPFSKEAVIMMGVGGMGAMNVKVFLWQTSNMGLLINGYQTVFPDFNITPMQLLLYNAPEIVVAFLFIFLVTKIFHTSEVKFEGGKEYFISEHEKMGKMTIREKKAAVLLVALMAYILFQPYHKFSMNYGFMVIPWLAFIPGVNVGDDQSIERIKKFFGTFLFAGSCITIGQVANALGLGALLADLMLPVLSSVGQIGLTYGVLILGAVANLLLTPAAMSTLLPTILGPIYQVLGFNPMVGMLTVIYSLDVIFLPHEVTAYLVLFGFGMMNMKQFVQFFGGKSLFTILMLGVIQIPWWHLMGLF